MTWDDVAELLNNELGENGTSNKYRKEFTRKFRDEIMKTEEVVMSEEDDLMARMAEQLIQIRKEKTVLADLRRDANAQLRSFDRQEHIAEIAKECAQEISKNIPKYTFTPVTTSKYQTKTGLLILSDWHFGIEINSFWNRYNPIICKERLQRVLDQVIPIAEEQDIKVLHVFNLGDLISGRIHSQLRMQSRIDAVEQTEQVAEMLHMFIIELRKHFTIEYYDCLDNHSRVEPNRKESLQLESFAKFIHWHLYWMFKDVAGVTVHENEYGEDIISANILGHIVLGVHGDKDTPTTVVKSMSSLIGEKPSLICTAHRHHFSGDETNRCPVLCNPSLMGQDQYALDGRLDSSPAQLFVILTKDNPMYSVHRLVVG